MSKLDWVASSAIAGHYEVINTHLPILESKIGRVDLRTISLEQADKIYTLGTRYLKKNTVSSGERKRKVVIKKPE